MATRERGKGPRAHRQRRSLSHCEDFGILTLSPILLERADAAARTINLPGGLKPRGPELARGSGDTTGTPLAAFLYISC